jgi:signal transduction histidine kinase
LISNAIKFRREDVPKIDITAAETEDSWVFSIEDNGIGIEAQELENVFVIFRRLHPELPGTGIGLSICRRIVERHGGRLWAEAAPAGGSRFRFSMPKIESESVASES